MQGPLPRTRTMLGTNGDRLPCHHHIQYRFFDRKDRHLGPGEFGRIQRAQTLIPLDRDAAAP